MKVNYQGNRDAKIVLLQIIGEHELPLLEEELSHIKAVTQSADFLFITVQVDSWNDDLSPWVAEPIFGEAAFAGNAEKFLTRIKNEVIVPYIKMIKSKVAYSVARAAKQKSEEKGVYKNLEAFISSGIDLIKTQEDYHIFVNLFEAAYGFYYELAPSNCR